MDRTVVLTQGSIPRQLIWLALPLICGNILQQLYNTVDAFIIGRFLGGAAFGAVGVAGTVMNLFIFILSGCCTGIAVLFAQFYGSRDLASFRREGFLSLVFGLLLTAVLASLLACNQTLTIILTHQLCAPSQRNKEQFAINLENSAVVVAPLIPWSIAGATPLSTVGAPMTGMAFACFLYILPLCELVRRTAQQRAAKKTAAQK